MGKMTAGLISMTMFAAIKRMILRKMRVMITTAVAAVTVKMTAALIEIIIAGTMKANQMDTILIAVRLKIANRDSQHRIPVKPIPMSMAIRGKNIMAISQREAQALALLVAND